MQDLGLVKKRGRLMTSPFSIPASKSEFCGTHAGHFAHVVVGTLSFASFLFAEVLARQLDLRAAARTLNFERWRIRRNARLS